MRLFLIAIVGICINFSLVQAKELTVEITFGTQRAPLKVVTHYEAGETALKVLQRVSTVGLRRVGEDLLFVASIEGVKSTPGKMGWFYTLDGKKAKVLANKKKLADVKQMHWFLAPQHCTD